MVFLFYSGTNRARTCDPLLVRQVLSQLSYDPKYLIDVSFDTTTQKRLELSTSAVTGRRSNQLSHWAILGMYLQNFIQFLKHLLSAFG